MIKYHTGQKIDFENTNVFQRIKMYNFDIIKNGVVVETVIHNGDKLQKSKGEVSKT
jgi:hypothetical protein